MQNANYIGPYQINILRQLPRVLLLRRFQNDSLTLHRLGIVTLGKKALKRLLKQEKERLAKNPQ